MPLTTLPDEKTEARGGAGLAQNLPVNRYQSPHFFWHQSRAPFTTIAKAPSGQTFMILHVWIHANCLEQCLVQSKGWIGIGYYYYYHYLL